jgi:hypothetical protein
LFDTYAWSTGVVGGFRTPVAREFIREADAIIPFDAEMCHSTTQGGALLQGRRESYRSMLRLLPRLRCRG